MEQRFKTPKERNTLDLLELVCQLHSRSVIFPNNEKMHQNYLEARKELECRLLLPTDIQEPAILCLLLKYEITNTWWTKLICNSWLQEISGAFIASKVLRKYQRCKSLKEPDAIYEIYELYKNIID